MSCLSSEQLAALALGQDENAASSAHLAQCAACAAKFENTQRLTARLRTMHEELNRNHQASHTRLLASLADVDAATPRANRWNRVKHFVAGLTPRQRIAAGGLGLSTAGALLLIAFILANSASQLSAMDRMARAIRDVHSYSYQLFTQDTFVRPGDTHVSTVIHTGMTYWLAPNSFCYEEKLERFEGPAVQGEGRLLSRLTGIHPSGQQGILIYHDGKVDFATTRTYWRIPEVQMEDVGQMSPITRLRMVREGDGEVLRELGTRTIDGKEARGYVMALRNAKPGSGFDALEVWLDAETDLPIEFGYEIKDDQLTRVFRISDCRWNIEIDPAIFDTMPPEGYTDVTPPVDEAGLAIIAAALRTYAEVSGGHYPRVTKINAHEIYAELLRLAGLDAVDRQYLQDNPTFQKIEAANVGIDWLDRLLRNKHNTGYYGATVGPQDKDKVLVWWLAAVVRGEDLYWVIYGDLRHELLPYSKWSQLVPPEEAAKHAPE